MQRVCNWEQVPRTRQVTRYRRVTQYRDEARTRIVTRTRTEERCCVTRTREVFDHQWQAKVTVNYPERAVLVGNETEKFQLKLVGDEQNPQLVVDPQDTVFGYVPHVQVLSANEFNVTFEIVPKYKAAELAKESIAKVQILQSGVSNLLILSDKGLRNRMTTSYAIQILAADGKVVAEGAWKVEGTKGTQEFRLPSQLAIGAAAKVNLAVTRESELLDQAVKFTTSTDKKVEEDKLYDIKPYIDSAKLAKFSIGGRGEKAVLNFYDLAKDISEVTTTYKIKVLNSKNVVVAEKSIERAKMKLEKKDGPYKLGFISDLGLTKEAAATLKAKTKVIIEVTAVREGRKFNPNPYNTTRKVTLDVN